MISSGLARFCQCPQQTPSTGLRHPSFLWRKVPESDAARSVSTRDTTLVVVSLVCTSCLKLLHRDFRRLQIFRDASHSMVMQQRLLSPAAQSIYLVSCLPCHSLRHVQVKMYVTLIIAVELYVIAFICCCFSFAVGVGI